MAYGVKGDSKMPEGRKPFGMNTSVTSKSFDAHGPTTHIHAGTNARTEVIRPHKFADGQEAMGTPAEHVHGKSGGGYLDADSLLYRAGLRGGPVRDNAPVQSKATKRYGRNPK